MNYLLDTHSFIWSITDTNKLSHTAIREITNTDNQIFVSAISFWEIALKSALGKLTINGLAIKDLPNYAEQMGFSLLSLSPAISASYAELVATYHKDPFDRMLIWQAINLDYPLITCDTTINKYKSEGLAICW
jgi:PIN domain nuclease of toxin-antitoxin system